MLAYIVRLARPPQIVTLSGLRLAFHCEKSCQAFLALLRPAHTPELKVKKLRGGGLRATLGVGRGDSSSDQRPPSRISLTNRFRRGNLPRICPLQRGGMPLHYRSTPALLGSVKIAALITTSPHPPLPLSPVSFRISFRISNT